MQAQLDSIKGYDILEKIGAGGFGEVYKAYQPILNREVAIKKILPDYANQTDFIRNFEAEAQRVARLEHPHIIPLYDFWRNPHGAYLVMRWLPTTLHNLLQKSSLSLADSSRLMKQVGAALDLTHQHGVIHRDIKPKNILVDDAGNFYLADFGIAKDLLYHEDATASNMFKGSLAYIAPEQATGDPISPQTDIYSLGVMLYEALAGEHPFKGLTSAQMLAKHLNEPLPFLPSNLALPEEIDTILQTATAKQTTERFRNVTEFVDAFCQMANGVQNYTIHNVSSRTQLPDQPIYTPHGIPLALRNPYKGLYAFERIDSNDFFGRSGLIENLISRFEEDDPYSNFLAIVGPSGSGKSSLVKAGLIPCFVNEHSASDHNWLIAEMTPAENPLLELKNALTRVATRSTSHIFEQLKSDKRGLVWAVASILTENAKLILVVDQFEELFTTTTNENDIVQFLDILRVAVEDSTGSVRIIITLRADFMDRPLQYIDFGEAVKQRVEYVLPMSGEEIQQAITQPAQRVGVTVEPELVASIISDIQDEPGALPLLQYTLTELFNEREGVQLSLAKYHELGGVLGALAQRAENLFLTLSDEQQRMARQIFLRLVTLGEGVEDTRRRIKQSELVSLVDNTPLLLDILDIFGRARLFTFDHDPQTREPTVEVAHEALLREWQRLQIWLDDSRHDIRQERSLATATKEWLNSNQNPDFLLRSSRLAQFEAWANETELALTQTEQEFLELSLTRRQQHQNRLRLIRGGAFVFVLAVAAIMAILALDAAQQRNNAQDALAVAEVARDNAEEDAHERKSSVLAISAKEALQTYNTDLALALALESYAVSPDSPDAMEAINQASYAPGTRMVLRGHSGPISTAIYSPDGRYILSGGGRLRSLDIRDVYQHFPEDSGDYSLRLWDANTGEIIREFVGHAGAIWDLDFSSDGRWALSGSADETVIVWDVTTGEIITQFTGHDMSLEPETVYSVAFSPDGKTVLSGDTGQVIWWDIQTLDILNTFVSRDADTRNTSGAIAWDIAFMPDGQSAVVGYGERGYTVFGRFVQWDLLTSEVLWTEDAHSNVHVVDISEDGRYLLTSGYTSLVEDYNLKVDESFVKLWDIETQQELQTFIHGFYPINGAQISPDNQYIATAGADHHIIIWDIANDDKLLNLRGHESWITDATYSPDSHQLVSTSHDGTLRIWDLYNGAQDWHIDYPYRIRHVDVSADGQFIAVASHLQVILLDAETGEEIRRFIGHDATVQICEFLPDGKTLLSAATDSTIRLWNLETGTELKRYVRTSNGIWDLDVALNARYVLLSEGPPGTSTTPSQYNLNLHDIEEEKIVRNLVGHHGLSGSVSISPDGLFALSNSEDRTVRMWDLTTGQEIQRFTNASRSIGDIVYHPSGELALSSWEESRIALWDLKTFEPIQFYEGHSMRIRDLVFSPDGKLFASISEDRLVIIWDTVTGNQLRKLNVLERGGAFSVEFTPDGRYIVTGGYQGSVIRWNIHDSPVEAIDFAQNNRYIRELNCSERETYQTDELCGMSAIMPTRTPYPSLTPTPENMIVASPPQLASTQSDIVFATYTPLATVTARPSPTPFERGTLTAGQPVNANIACPAMNQDCVKHTWYYNATQAEIISISFNQFGLDLTIVAPDGSIIHESTDTSIKDIVLEQIGTYQIIVGSDMGRGATYSLSILPQE